MSVKKFKNQKFTTGFTLIEIVIALAIVATITLIVSGSFSTANNREALSKKTALVLSLLEQARAQTLSAKGGVVYGVHFETTKAVLFTGPTYSAGSATNVSEPLGSLVQISNIALAGGVSDVIFQKLTGQTSQSGTIVVILSASSTQSKTITVSATGIASVN